MANWNALRWSEQVKTGQSTARHVLTVLCLKSDDDGVTYRDATGLADLCEMSVRTLKTWRDYLDERGFITVIRRIRRDGREAKPLTLVNYPEAPHLSGQPVRLDYNGKYLYPHDPAGLAGAGIQWIAGERLNEPHPSASSARGPRANAAPGLTSDEDVDDQNKPRANPSRGPRASSSPHVGGAVCTPKSVPAGSNPPSEAVGHDQAADDAAAQPEVGGRTDDLLIQEQPETAPAPDQAAADGTLGSELVNAPEIQDALTRIDLRPVQRQQLITEVDRALLRFPLGKVAAYLHRKVITDQPRTVKYVLTAFNAYADNIGDEHDSTRQQQTKRDGTVLANVSHPPAYRQATKTAPAPAASPVDWLTDAQFRDLGKQDRAALLVWSQDADNTPSKLAGRVAGIRARYTASAA